MEAGQEREGFTSAVRATAERYGMDLSRPLALVSGGPDSVALLRALVGLGGKPVVLHVEHGVRGTASLEDAAFVRGLCERLGVRFEVRRLGLEAGANFQERARTARYRVSEEVADSLGLETVVTGHTADDVAETILMNLARGAGLRGLAGIPPVRGRFARPLIRQTRNEVLAYLEKLSQPYRTDESNLTGKYARNRVRREVLPVLEDMYPGAARNMARSAALLREDLEALESLAAGVVFRRGGEMVIDQAGLSGVPCAVRRHAVRRAYAELVPGAPAPDAALVEAVLGLLGGGEGTRMLSLPGGVVAAARTTGELAFYAAGGVPEETLEVREGRFVFGEWEVEAWQVAAFDAADAARPEVAYLDAERGPYRVRTARDGDSIRPLGLGGSKKVLRAMMDRGLPRDLRRRVPVVVAADGGVAWISGGELGEDYRVRGQTEKVLRLEVKRAREDD